MILCLNACLIMHFNFHHRVVETFVIIAFTASSVSFNFHHRVVETFYALCVLIKLMIFNFHHRVVETIIKKIKKRGKTTLTFTIGWLKLNYVRVRRGRCFALTFTIGWLKQVLTRGGSLPHKNFNFHHRVVETDIMAFSKFVSVTLTFTIGWLKQAGSLTRTHFI